MNSSKIAVLVALCAMLLGAPTLALADPSTSTSSQSAGHRGGWGSMLKNLDLTTQQQDQIKSLIEAYRQAHPQGSQPDRAERKQLREQILALLTPEQRAQLEQEEQQRRDERQGQGQGPDSSPPPSPEP
jgi:Spy/CpxP family protein refolding chaperone